MKSVYTSFVFAALGIMVGTAHAQDLSGEMRYPSVLTRAPNTLGSATSPAFYKTAALPLRGFGPIRSALTNRGSSDADIRLAQEGTNYADDVASENIGAPAIGGTLTASTGGPDPDGAYEESMKQSWDDSGCVECGESCCGPVWFFGLYGMNMSRDRENPVFFSYSDEDESIQLLNSRDVNFDWGGGFEARIGRMFCGSCWGLEGVYWGLYPETEEVNTLLGRDINPGFNLRSTLDFSGLIYDAGDGAGAQDASVWFDNNVARHRIRGTNEIHNIELNLVSRPLFGTGWCCGAGAVGCGGGACGHGGACGASRLNAGWLLGVRYLRFEEQFQLASDRTNQIFGDNPFDEMFFDIDVHNNLVGAQLGGHLDYCLTRRWSLSSELKYGLYGNHITHRSIIGGANGVATVGAGPNAGRPYFVDSSKDDVSFIGELRFGFGYQLHQRWRLSAGYRAVAVTGVALATNQIPPDLRGIDDAIDIDSNASLILHGSYYGLEYTW